MFKRIGLAEMIMHQRKVLISTVKLNDNLYETLVFYNTTGDEIEMKQTRTLADAKKTHNALMNKYNDEYYENSINKLLGEPNYGQFVTAIVAC